MADNIRKDLGAGYLEYVWFDFHHECRQMKWENLSRLVAIVKDELDDYDYYQADIGCGFDNWDELRRNASVTVKKL